MARPKAPCGTYPAYQRHLREGSEVDSACRRAQREHDEGRGRRSRASDRGEVRLTPALAVSGLEESAEALRARYLSLVHALERLVRHDDLYGVIDTTQEMENVLDEWLDVRDQIRGS